MDLVDAARELLASGPLCDACLGRPVADRSFGLRNADRGRALRTTVALVDDTPFEDPDTDCWVCHGLCTEFDALADRALDTLAGTEFYTYQIGTRLPPLLEENERLLRTDAGFEPDAGEPLKTEVNREVGRRIGADLSADVDFQRPNVQLTIDIHADTIDVHRNSLPIYGRYRKLERGIPQTEWDKYDTSVEELIAPPFLTTFRGTDAVFHGAGREDVDALMLGDGRPFVLEVKHPRRRTADLTTLTDEVTNHANNRVEVTNLTYTSYEMIERVKEHAASKTYRAHITFTDPVTTDAVTDALATLDGATIEQRTPNRVAHRRADRIRERTVYTIDGTLTDETTATIEIHGEGGLYIKELISGDDGRTTPSLSSLLSTDATVTHLDVIDVQGEAAPFLTDDYTRTHDHPPATPGPQ